MILISNIKQNSIYLALIYSLSLDGGSFVYGESCTVRFSFVPVSSELTCVTKTSLNERFKVNKKVQRFKDIIWILRRKVQRY